MENCYDHDGEQLGFYEKAHMKTQSKKKDVHSCNFIARKPNEEF